MATTPAIRKNSLYCLVSGGSAVSWETARTAAQALGGDLTVINDAGEDSYLYSHYRYALDNATGEINPTNIGGVFIGLSYSLSDGKWKWVDGSNLSDGYSNWWSDIASTPQGYNYSALWIRNTGDPSVECKWYATKGTYQGIAEIPLTSSISLPTSIKEGAGVFTTLINLSAGTQTCQRATADSALPQE